MSSDSDFLTYFLKTQWLGLSYGNVKGQCDIKIIVHALIRIWFIGACYSRWFVFVIWCDLFCLKNSFTFQLTILLICQLLSSNHMTPFWCNAHFSQTSRFMINKIMSLHAIIFAFDILVHSVIWDYSQMVCICWLFLLTYPLCLFVCLFIKKKLSCETFFHIHFHICYLFIYLKNF